MTANAFFPTGEQQIYVLLKTPDRKAIAHAYVPDSADIHRLPEFVSRSRNETHKMRPHIRIARRQSWLYERGLVCNCCSAALQRIRYLLSPAEDRKKDLRKIKSGAHIGLCVGCSQEALHWFNERVKIGYSSLAHCTSH